MPLLLLDSSFKYISTRDGVKNMPAIGWHASDQSASFSIFRSNFQMSLHQDMVQHCVQQALAA